MFINAKETLDLARAGLERIGFGFIMSYVCPNVPTPDGADDGETGILVAYLQKTACIVCVEVCLGSVRRYATFTLAGQLKDRGYPSAKLRIPPHRHFCETESPDGDFSRQLCCDEARTIDVQIGEGIAFLGKFLAENGGLLADRFLYVPFLAIAPVQTTEYLEAGKSVSRTGPQEYFEARVLPKLPVEIMPPKAEPVIAA